jgi:hypothetical protein
MHDMPLEELEHEPGPIEVRVVNVNEETKSDSADLSSWVGWNLLGTEAPFQLLPQDDKRLQADIWVNGIAGNFVLLCKSNQTAAKQGAQIFVGNNIIYKAKSEVWCVPMGTPLVISVNDVRYK